MTRATSLNELGREPTQGLDKLPAFMALDLGGLIMPESIQALTPRLMAWSSDIWLLDLSVCESYWVAQAAARGMNALELVRALLGSITPSAVDGEAQPSLVPSSLPSPRAALASHPWQALLLVNMMRERRLTGLVTAQGAFGTSLYRDVSWDVWWECVERLVDHFTHFNNQDRRVNLSTFKSQCEQMRRAIKRLALAAPWQIKDAAPAAIKRRFGVLMRDLWE